MDPNANLREQLALAEKILADTDGDSDTYNATRLAELVQSLHGWLSRGGFLPRAWDAAGEVGGKVK